MFGLTLISSSEYEQLTADGDRVRYLEGDREIADNALKTVEERLQNILSECERSQNTNEQLEHDLALALESVANLQKAIAEVKHQLSESQSLVNELETQNQNQINTIAKFVAQCDELIVEKSVLKANYRQSVAIAVDNLSIEIKNIFGEI